MDRREKHHLIDALREGIPFPGVEYLAPYFYTELASIFSYLPAETLIWLDGADRVEAETERFGRLAWQRCESAKEERRLVAEAQALFLNEHEWRAALATRPFDRALKRSSSWRPRGQGERRLPPCDRSPSAICVTKRTQHKHEMTFAARRPEQVRTWPR